MLWINFLHLYQPANSDEYIIREALDKSYWRLVRLLEENPHLKMTFNISGCLLERLAEMGETEFITRIGSLLKKKQLELTGSASYHAFLPLIPEEESLRQIKENEEILRRYFGADLKLTGFFFPEMAFTPQLLSLVKNCGYSWVILDEIAALYSKDKDFDFSRPFINDDSGLKIIFRSRKFSCAYPPDEIVRLLKEGGKDTTIVSATDGELYGLRHEDPTAEMESIVSNQSLKTALFSDFIASFPEENIFSVELRSSSWESSEEDIGRGEAFSLWLRKGNLVHKQLWHLTNFVLALEKKYQADQNFFWFRWHLKRGLASCTYWWASAHDFSDDFGPYTWNPDIVERGAGDLVRAVRSLADKESRQEKLQAEKYYLKFKKTLWREHWLKHWPQKKQG